MKRFSIFLSIIIGLCSVFLFKDNLTDLATSILAAFDSNTNTTNPTFQDPQGHLFATNMSVSRTIRKVFLAIEQSEGAGARVRRSIGTPSLRNFSPFLMLDHFSIKPGAGFPDQ